MDDYLAKKSSIKKVNSEDEAIFENKISEISKSPEDIKMNYCNVIKECWNFKIDCILAIIASFLMGLLKYSKGQWRVMELMH